MKNPNRPFDQVGWQEIQHALQILASHQSNPMASAVVVGGAAAFIYHSLLDKANDPDFPSPLPAPGENWLSKDIDLTGIFREEIQLGDEVDSVLVEGRPVLMAGGVRLGFLQIGLTFGPDDALAEARTIKAGDACVNVLDPVMLYREKDKMVLSGRGKANDNLHRKLAATYALFELAEALADALAAMDSGAWKLSARRFQNLRDRAPELLQDERLLIRLGNLMKASPAAIPKMALIFGEVAEAARTRAGIPLEKRPDTD